MVRIEADHEVVVGVDGSEESIEALRYAGTLAPFLNATLHVITTWDYPAADPLLMPFGSGEFADVTRRDLNRALVAAYGYETPPRLRTTVVFARPARALLEASRHAALLIVGRRGNGRVPVRGLGSVSSACVSRAQCPVLVVPRRLADGEEVVPRTAKL
ncbi:universal stress protein [Arthrobacter sp. KR32]|uniref:Universal stress protein n=1 Tax=Arthrobacter bussei TaxID=2594179 RepID=A0A7X1TMP6_9MICC|nr:universal stress protein [Arthrobacter bussei]